MGITRILKFRIYCSGNIGIVRVVNGNVGMSCNDNVGIVEDI
jgi:hypothetical protein